MEVDEYADHDMDDFELQSTQQTQQTQENSQQPLSQPSEPHLWGFLQHCAGSMSRIELKKDCLAYKFGRHKTNSIVFSGITISNFHCTITWDGAESDNATVVVQDHSSNGTYINRNKVGRGNTSILRDGNEIAFGTCIPSNNRNEDIRFIFRLIASGNPTEGLYASYDVGKEIGRGNFGTVMKALHRRTGEWFAVKIIPDRLSTLPVDQTIQNENEMQEEVASGRKALMREVSIMQKLKHDNICQLKEVFYFGVSGMHLVLEYVEGGDLLEYLLKHNGLGEVDARYVTHQICSALRYMHDMDIAHRDLKPENVLLTKHTPPIVKIADFGLAKAVDGGLTMLRTMCGTPNYLAPEVLRQVNKEGYDHLVDSWSVGVIVFSMLTAATPFSASVAEDNSNATEYDVNWPLLFEFNVSEEAVHFIELLLQPDPLYRMSMEEALAHPWLNRA